MHRSHLLTLLSAINGQENFLNEMRNFISTNADCFDRENTYGHMTASAFIVTPDFEEILLMHHKKLDRWMQLGGHADSHTRLDEVALKEAFEESGLMGLTFYQKTPFDIDIHQIPEWKNIPSHKHFDVRFLFIAQEKGPLIHSDESHDMKWISLDRVLDYTNEPSILRPLEKIKHLASIEGT